MTVFDMFLKLVKSRRKMILCYIILFVGMFLAFYQMSAFDMGNEASFQSTMIPITVIDQDQSEISEQLTEYLSESCEIKEVGTTEEDIRDAMYFAEISYAITIPEGFAQSMLAGTPLPLQSQKKPDSTSGYMVEARVNAYLQKFQILQKNNPELTTDELHETVMRIVATKADVSLGDHRNVTTEASAMSIHFNYLSYIFLALTILVGGMIMMQIYHGEIRKRQLVSPVSNLSFNLQIWLASILCVLVFWAIFMVEIQIIIGDLFTVKGFFYAINALLFIFVAMGITLLVGSIISGRRHGGEVIDGCANVFGLGFSFLGGAFVPQYLLSDSVKLIGSFTPTFWYVKTNDALMTMNDFSFDAMKGIYTNYGILLLFIVVTFLLALYIMKMKSSSEDLS